VKNRAPRARIADVAVEAGVSKSTVSIAFNSPERLHPDTAARIRAVADALGYKPHPVARMLAQRRTLTIGILTPQALRVAFLNPFFSDFSHGVASVAEEFNYQLLFVSPLRGSLARAAGRATVDGFVVIGLGEEHPEVGQIRAAGLPIVLVDSAAFPEHSSIEVDDTAGAAAAARHLLDLGHTEYLVIAVEPPDQAGRDGRTVGDRGGVTGRRLAGYRAALDAAGLALPDERVIEVPATFAGGEAAVARAIEDGIGFTAILAMSDAMAVGAIHGVQMRGLRVPDDVSVVGFDDIEGAEYSNPPLTTIHQPIAEKGAEAVRLLMAAIEGSNEPPEHRRFDTRLVIRNSTTRPPAGRTTVQRREV